MSNRLVAAAVALATCGLFAGAAEAADSINVTVNATVNGVCKFGSGQTPTVTIANTGSVIDPSLSTTATGTANINYRCTNGTAPTFTVTSSPATLTCTTSGTCGSTTMSATVTTTSGGAGAGFTTDKVLVVTGQITPAVYQVAQAGTYAGTVSVAVSP